MGFKGSKDENWFAGNCAVNVTSWFACRLYFCAWANTYFHVGHIHGEKMGEMGRLEVCVSVKCPEGIGWYTFIHLPFQVATILVQFAKGTFWPTICHMVFAHQFSFCICKLSGRYENRILLNYLTLNSQCVCTLTGYKSCIKQCQMILTIKCFSHKLSIPAFKGLQPKGSVRALW